jgi:hypothetical protein
MSHRWKLTSSETLDLTGELATKFSGMPASPTERDVKAKRLKYLQDVINGGLEIAFNWSTCLILSTGEVIRLNGQHSSRVLAEIAKANGAFPAGLKVHLDQYEAESMQDAVLIFRQIDNRQSARTPDDISGAYQGVHPTLRSTPKGAARKAIEGAAWFLSVIRGADIPSGDDRFDLFNDTRLHAFVQMVGRILTIKTNEFTKPVIGAMFGTWELSPSEAEQFWTTTSKEKEDVDHPTTVLDRWLVAARDGAIEKPSEIEIYAACAHAWVASRHNRTMTEIPRFSKKKGAPDLD